MSSRCYEKIATRGDVLSRFFGNSSPRPARAAWTKRMKRRADDCERTPSCPVFAALDRLRLQGKYPEEKLATTFGALLALFAPIDFLDVTPVVLERAAQPFRLPLKTLDAIHLATALLWRESEAEELAFATHDSALGSAAQSYDLKVLGL